MKQRKEVEDILKRPVDEANIKYDDEWISAIADVVMRPSSLSNGAFRGCIDLYEKDVLMLFNAAVNIKYADRNERETYLRAFDKIYAQICRRGEPTCKNCTSCVDVEDDFEEEFYEEGGPGF